MGKKQKLEGQLIPLAISGPSTTVSGAPLTGSDLDEMVNNFHPTSKADHLPIRFGRAKSNGPIVAKISGLQRAGDKLMGKLSDVDPRFEELYNSGKLGGRSSRSLAFERDDEKGKSLAEFGFMPPPVFHRGSLHDGPATDEALSDLLDAHREGDCITYSANGAGHLELVFPEVPRAGRAAKRVSASPKSNSAQLHELIVKYQESHGGADKVSYGDAMTTVARAHPELTLPDGIRPVENRNRLPQTNSAQLHELTTSYMEQHGMKSVEYGEALTAVSRAHPELTSDRPAAAGGREPDNPLAGYRWKTNSERLNEAAQALADDLGLSFSEALSRTAHDNPALTYPDDVLVIDNSEPRQLTNGEKLTKLAKSRADKRRISFGEALSQVARENPELTLRD